MLDMVSSGDNLQEKSKLYLLEKYEKCLAVFPSISMYPSLSLATKGSNSTYEKNIYIYKKKMLIKSLLFHKSLPNLAILSVYILFNSTYV